MEDRNLGRANPAFQLTNNPQTFASMIQRHGLYVRILESRKCPCIKEDGHPDNSCTKCRGEGEIYQYQRELLETDELNYVTMQNRCKIEPYRIPLLRPISVERMLPERQGGIREYPVESFDGENIYIAAEHPPAPYYQMRLSYYFDRYDYIQGEELTQNAVVPEIFKSEAVTLESQYIHAQHIEVSGDIVSIERLYSDTQEYTSFSYSKNMIIIEGNIASGERVYADMYYASPARAIPSRMEYSDNEVQKTMRLPMGELSLAVDPWWNVGRGDLFTFLMVEFIQDEVITHSGISDRVSQFDVSNLPSQIQSETDTFKNGTDYILFGYREIRWIGKKPSVGDKYSVRYRYHPTYRVGDMEAEINNLDSKQFSKIVPVKLWTAGTDIEPQKVSQGYVNESSEHSNWLE
jgi:hypothetical protein